MKFKQILLGMLFIATMSIILLQGKTYAASASITASKSTAQKGETIEIKANIGSASAWALDVQTNGGTLTKSDDRVGNTNSGNNENSTVKLGTFTADTAGTYTITLTGYVVDGSGEIPQKVNVSGNVKITIQEPKPDGGNTGGNNGNNSGNTGNNGGSTTGGNTTVSEPKFTSVSKTVYTTGEINLRSSWSTSSSATVVSKGTELRLTGTSTEKVNGYVWYRVTYEGKVKYVSKDLITETKPEEKSNNANLKSISIENAELTPNFDANVTEYSAKISDYEETKINITAVAEDEKSTVKVEGNENIVVGENVITITVTAEDGTTKIYTITLVNEKTTVLGLSNLIIRNAELKNFSTSIFEYTVEFKDLDQLDIVATANEEGATVEILGNENLAVGENVITIIVTSADGTKTATYQIKATKLVTEVQETQKQVNGKSILISALIAFVVLVVIILLIVKYAKKDNNSTIDYIYNDNLNTENKKDDIEIADEITPKKEEIEEDNNYYEEEPRRPRRGKHSK